MPRSDEGIVFGEVWICPTCGRLTVTRVAFRVGIAGRDYCEMCQPNTLLEALFDVVSRPYHKETAIMYQVPIDAYMLRYDDGALVAVPVRLTSTRVDSAPVAAEALARGRITFVAPETLAALVADDYPAHVSDLAATMQARQPHEIRISTAGIEARCLVEAV